MTNRGIAPHSIVIDGIVDGFVRSGDVGEAISFAQHAFNQVNHAAEVVLFCLSCWFIPLLVLARREIMGCMHPMDRGKQEPSVPPRVFYLTTVPHAVGCTGLGEP